MEDPSYQLLFLSAILIAIFVKLLVSYVIKIKALPPGPWGLPFVGYIPWLGEFPHEAFLEIGKKYGGVFSMGFGMKTVVVLNDYKAMKEAFVDQGKITSARSAAQISDLLFNRKDVVFGDGPIWKKQRILMIQCLRNLGMGKKIMEPKVMDIVHEILETLNQTKEGDAYMESVFFHPIFKSNWRLISGENVEQSKVRLDDIEQPINAIFLANRGNNPVNIFPWLRFFPPDGFGYWTTKAHRENIIGHLKTAIEEHLEKWTESSEFDLIDLYIAQIKSHKSLEPPYNMEYLTMTILDMFLAGVDTTNITCLWGVKCLAYYPQVQEKVQQELDRVVGRERFPSVTDMPNLPYLEATVMEIHRVSTLAPLSVPHKTTSTTKINGYNIPKDTEIIQNIYGVHNDPELWNNPDVFDPDRYFDSNNKLIVPPFLIPFSLGPRICPGQALAEMQLRIIFGCILQHFTFALPRSHRISGMAENSYGITLKPKPFYLHVTKRGN